MSEHDEASERGERVERGWRARESARARRQRVAMARQRERAGDKVERAGCARGTASEVTEARGGGGGGENGKAKTLSVDFCGYELWSAESAGGERGARERAASSREGELRGETQRDQEGERGCGPELGGAFSRGGGGAGRTGSRKVGGLCERAGERGGRRPFRVLGYATSPVMASCSKEHLLN